MKIEKTGYMGVVQKVKNDYVPGIELISETEEQRYKKNRYRSLATKTREIRRNLILEMMMSDPHGQWSYRRISEEAQKLPWFQENMPTYSLSTAREDYLVIKEETRGRREELAEDALVAQLDDIRVEMQSIRDDLESLGSLHEYMRDAPDMSGVSQFIKAKNTLLNALNRLQEREAKLLPIDIPKRVEIDSRHVTLDAYLEVRKEYRGELEPGKYIDGDYEEQD